MEAYPWLPVHELFADSRELSQTMDTEVYVPKTIASGDLYEIGRRRCPPKAINHTCSVSCRGELQWSL